MKLLTLVALSLASLASAGVVITPIRPDQVIEKASDDCYFGVTTPQGCGCVFSPPSCTNYPGTCADTWCRPARAA